MTNSNNQHEIESLGNSIPCLILSDRALTCMIRALSLQDNHSLFPPQVLSLEELILLLSADGTSELELALFVASIHFFVHHTDFSIFHHIKMTQLSSLIRKVDDLLCLLSPRLTISRDEVYYSIF